MLGLSDRGIAVGKDFAVIGFDNIPEAAHHRPTLTTVEIDGRQIGAEAARLLVRRIKIPDAPQQSIVIAPRLIIRSSCGGDACRMKAQSFPQQHLLTRKREASGRKDHERTSLK